MKIAVTGSSGLVGRALLDYVAAKRPDVTVIRLVRRTPRGENELEWRPETGKLDAAQLEGVDAVVHLAGQGVAEQRWTEAFKQRISDSRVLGTRNLVNALLALERPPRLFVSASGIGYYGDAGDAWVDEASPPGHTFLAGVCQAWEAEARRAEPNIRTVQVRIGMVLSKSGGALRAMLPAFKLGVGGRLGDGRQFISWIALTDLVRVFLHAIETEVSGPLNAISPHPVSNREFTATLAHAVRRKALLPVPAFALRAAFGELAEELLGGQRARPEVLCKSAFRFEHEHLDGALAAALDE